MKANKSSPYPLLILRDAIDRVWKNSLMVGLFVAALWALTGREYPYLGFIPGLPEPYDLIAIITAPILLILSLGGILFRRLAYVRAQKDHIRIVTPVYPIKISYRRVRSIRPMNFGEFLSKQNISGLEKRGLRQYASKTTVVLVLNGYPLPYTIMRLLLGPMVMSAKAPGIVLLVPDWMVLSTELDSFHGAWRESQSQQAQSGKSYEILHGMKNK